ncbi:MAG: MFS transporter [Lentisphaeria bacterium]|nr:MFS transporter [Lentisphaeria bacterium]
MSNRWVVLAAGIAMQVVLGGLYAWSVFVPRLIEDHAFSKGQCGLVFGVSIAVFTVAMIGGGRLLDRRGPRLTAFVGALLFTSGYVLASLSDGHFWVLLLAIGGFSGAGIGFGYVCPLTVGMKWFPARKGLITGIAVAGFGGGGMLLSWVASGALGQGVDVLRFFAWLGVLAGAVLVVASLLLAVPDAPAAGPDGSRSPLPSALRSAVFLLSALGMFAGTFSGLLVIGNLTPIATAHGVSLSTAAHGVSAFALGNASGRVLWGHLCDRLQERTIPLSLAFLAVGILLLPSARTDGVFLAIAIALGFGFGANFVVYASVLSRRYGIDAFPRLYPLCFLGYGLAGVTGPPLGGFLADVTGSYNSSVYASVGLLALATAATGIGLRPRRV